MAGKGRAEHGGGAAKWRHGWIPVNAAARAIVAARAARKTEEKSSELALFPKPKAKRTFPALDTSRFGTLHGRHDGEADAINVNPKWLDARTNNDPAFTTNCSFCVQAWELRRRGLAVEAAPIPGFVNGMELNEIAHNWKLPSGTTARFHVEPVTVADQILGNVSEESHRKYVEQQTKNWPVGARGFIGCVWANGGGHIFAVEKQGDGLHFYDPQPGVDLGDGSRYFKHMMASAVMRTDDKTPTSEVGHMVVPGRSEGSPLRPGRSILTAKPDASGVAALDKKIAQTETALKTTTANGRTEDAANAATMIQAFKDARGRSPKEIMAMISKTEDDFASLKITDIDKYDYRRDTLRAAMKLQHPGLKEFAKHEVALDQDQGDDVPGDLSAASIGRVTGLPSDIPRIKGAHDLNFDLTVTNPLFAIDMAYQTNCVHAVTAYELRRRGYDVTASPLPREFMDGRSVQDAVWHWKQPGATTVASGMRSLERSSASGVTNIVNNWPVGARGWVLVYWKDGGSHVIAVERTPDGVRFVDPQSGRDVDPKDYAARSAPLWQIVRTDDLEPGKDVLQYVHPVGTGTTDPRVDQFMESVRHMPKRKTKVPA